MFVTSIVGILPKSISIIWRLYYTDTNYMKYSQSNVSKKPCLSIFHQNHRITAKTLCHVETSVPSIGWIEFWTYATFSTLDMSLVQNKNIHWVESIYWDIEFWQYLRCISDFLVRLETFWMFENWQFSLNDVDV